MIPISISHVPQHLGEVPTTIEAKNCNSMGPRDFKPCGYGSKTQKVFDPRMGWTSSCNPYDILAKKLVKSRDFPIVVPPASIWYACLAFYPPKECPWIDHVSPEDMVSFQSSSPCPAKTVMRSLKALSSLSLGQLRADGNGACKIHSMNLHEQIWVWFKNQILPDHKFQYMFSIYEPSNYWGSQFWSIPMPIRICGLGKEFQQRWRYAATQPQELKIYMNWNGNWNKQARRRIWLGKIDRTLVTGEKKRKPKSHGNTETRMILISGPLLR